MAEKSISVRLGARVDAYVAAMKRAEASTTGFSRATRRNLQQVGGQMQNVGRQMTTMVTVPLALMGAGAVKAAVDWESAWAGVTKTVDGTAAQMSTLEQGLRDMAKELPATHGEIAAVAEAAGQLGVGVEDIEDFTRVMIDLGETTNLSATDAATSLARFMNVMGTGQGEVSNLGSAIVDLGNNFETTEAEIVEMATRLSAAGRIAGLSESDVLGFATALTSVGVKAEAGGTAFSKVFQDISVAVARGGEDLETFATVAGMSAQEFRRAYEEDAAGAIVAFVTGLAQLAPAEQAAALDALGLSGERVKRALLSAGLASDTLTGALGLAEDAWRDNTALADEAAKRYETTAAQFEMVRNKVVDLGIDLGRLLLPAVESVVDAIASMAGAIQSLPAPVQSVILAIAGLAAAAGPLVFITGSLVKNWVTLAATFRSGVGATTRITGALGLLGLAAIAGFAAYQMFTSEQRRTEENTRQATQALGDQLPILLGTAIAAAEAGSQIDAVAIANEALSQALAGANDQLAASLSTLNVSGDQVLDFLTLMEGGADNAVTAIDFLARSFSLTAEQAHFVATNFDDFNSMNRETQEAVSATAQELGITEEQLNVLIPAIRSVFQAWDESDPQQVARDFLDLQVQLHGYEDSLIAAAEAELGFTRQTGDAVEVYRKWAEMVAAATPEQRAAAGITDEMATAIASVDPATFLASQGLGEFKAAAEEGALGAEKLREAVEAMDFDAAAQSADAWRTAVDLAFQVEDNITAAEDLTVAMSEFHEQVHEVGKGLDETSTHFDVNTEAGLRNRDAIIDVRDRMFELAARQLATGKSTEEVTTTTEGYIDALRREMDQAGFTEAEIDNLLFTYGLTPETIETVIKLHKDELAKQKIRLYMDLLGDVPPEVASEIIALIEEGKFQEAAARLARLGQDIDVPIDVYVRSAPRLGVYNGQVTYSYGSGQQAVATGGYIMGPTWPILAGEAGAELVLPLTNMGRIERLLSDSNAAPVWSAMSNLMAANSYGGHSAPTGGGDTYIDVKVSNNGRDLTGDDIARAIARHRVTA